MTILFALLLSTAHADRIEGITVYGTKKPSELDFVPTVSEISGEKLRRKQQSTLGASLSREAGISSSQFGPNASRPVILALDGDRIRILQNGTGVLDASSASQDHAVAMDPIVIDRIEIVRGPAALLYGSNAIGGVVNMDTTRIPEEVPENFEGKAEARGSSNDLGRSGAIALKKAMGSDWVVHADGSARGAEDYRVPGFARTQDVRDAAPLAPEDEGRVYNSFNRTQSGALGVSRVFGEKGFLGTSYAAYDSNYGVVAERAVNIRMKQRRWDVGGEAKNVSVFRSVRFKNSYSNYLHEEIEEGETGTRFKNDGNETRLDLKHGAVAGFAGVFGVQWNTFDFSAEGDEAYLPGTSNQALSAFVFEEREEGTVKPSFGARVDSSEVESEESVTFGPSRRRTFGSGSASLGVLVEASAHHAFALNAAYTERAPNYQELFANGRHVATRQNEVGNADLGLEHSHSAELSWRYKGGSSQSRLSVFLQDFHDFIALEPSGTDDGDPEDPFEIYNYQAVNARFYGAELEWRRQLGRFELELKADFVRGVNRQTGHSLPRVTPIRETLGLYYKLEPWRFDVQVERSERQTKTAPNEEATGEYTLVHLGAERPVYTGFAGLNVFARLNNVFDQEARNHVSVLKEIAPLPGRNLIIGVTAVF